MKRGGQILLGLCFALLILLGAATLVEGPQGKPPETAPMPAAENVRLTAAWETADMPSGMLQVAQERNLRKHAAQVCIRVQEPAMIPLCESNGRPITSRSWARTVYTACSLEDWAG